MFRVVTPETGTLEVALRSRTGCEVRSAAPVTRLAADVLELVRLRREVVAAGLSESDHVAAHALAVGVGAVLHERAEGVRMIRQLPGLVLGFVTDPARLAARVATRTQQHRH